jgi:hypothetical protein
MKGSIKARNDLLRATTSSFCQALLDPPPPAELITKYFTSASPCITEHGPEWARSRLPFLAKTFTGPSGCEEYFSALSRTLKMHMEEDTFPSSEGYIVDTEATVGESGLKGAVSAVGKATFESIETGKQWQEQFTYRFSGFDDAGKIGHWEIWADPLSAWAAVGGSVPPANLLGTSLVSTPETGDDCNEIEDAILGTRISILENSFRILENDNRIHILETRNRNNDVRLGMAMFSLWVSVFSLGTVLYFRAVNSNVQPL